MSFLAKFFTWWNGQTFGTQFYTWRKGKRVGEDAQGNVFYQSADGSAALGDLQRRGRGEPGRRPSGTAGCTTPGRSRRRWRRCRARPWEKPHRAEPDRQRRWPIARRAASSRRGRRRGADYEAWAPE